MTDSLLLAPVFNPQTPHDLQQSTLISGKFTSDYSLEFLKFSNEVFDFLKEAKGYWATNGLLNGYSKAILPISQHLEEALQGAHPFIQANAGSWFGVAKLFGGIYFGAGHWVHRSLRDTVDHDLGAGFKTFLSIPAHGLVEGVKFLWQQGNRWSQGEIAKTTFGVGDEVASTLGTAVLMFFGLKSMHQGGKGLGQSLENIRPQPALLGNNAMVFPGTATAVKSGPGLAPWITGTLLMSSHQNKDGQGGSLAGESPINYQKLARETLKGNKIAAFRLKILAQNKDPLAIEALVACAEEFPERFLPELTELAHGGSEHAFHTLMEIHRSGYFYDTLTPLYEFVVRERRADIKAGANHPEGSMLARVNRELAAMDVPTLLRPSYHSKGQVKILRERVLQEKAAFHRDGSAAYKGLVWQAQNGFSPALAELADLALSRYGKSTPGPIAEAALQDLFHMATSLEIKGSARQQTVNLLIEAYPKATLTKGVEILNFLIQAAAKRPGIAELLLKNLQFEMRQIYVLKLAQVLTKADFRPIYDVAKRDGPYADLLAAAYNYTQRQELIEAITNLSDIQEGIIPKRPPAAKAPLRGFPKNPSRPTFWEFILLKMGL